ncbi:putative oxidoreductases of the aldo/keto reductase family [Candidatus Sulfotelmatomonas gaucii]|uniref:Putative oxidoreductases of the aldo/keto reductase family n=1 Tax=Candidatus Sulfuritelmatomonas gaucii TaxID=2043161 RepID=A0A2N9LK53_9BACT|nr:putative oxidoreductases of the aldo/keto reductase family [Candidatus Sulfotelmatomonas gaucii]
MQYRTFGKLDWKSSVLGFGCMRLPTMGGQRGSANINEPEAIRMLRFAIDHGVNYVDTAYPYHDGKSELVVGKALRDGYRDKVRLATKLPTWLVKAPSDFDRYLNEQLAKLETDHIDFYLLHSLNKATWTNIVLKQYLLREAERALADGRIRHLGFSFHDNYECFAEIVNTSDLFAFCQIQYNYMDIENQAGTRGLKLAADKGLAVVVMEPLMGGRLADPPPAMRETIAGDPAKRSPAQLAFEWIWDQPEVSAVLSGMSTMDQVVDNLQFADTACVAKLAEVDQGLIARIREQYKARVTIPCTQCGYCMPCPNGVNIPVNFDFFNYAHTYDDVGAARFRYHFVLKEEERAGACIDCDTCEELCPQHIPISDWMPKVAALLS